MQKQDEQQMKCWSRREKNHNKKQQQKTKAEVKIKALRNTLSKVVAKNVLPPPKDEVERTSSSNEYETDEEGNFSPPEKGKEIPTTTLVLKPKQTKERRERT